MQNIGGENAGDAFYRYKMPKLIAKIEGRGNGIKTNVVNNVDIAKALARPPEYILKFYGCELGAQTNYDKNLGTSIVNGAHDTKKLCELLESFIKKYVQCYSCGNPETVMKLKRECIFLKCKACGYVSDVDMRHKVNTFILKNPPENKLSKEEKRLKKAEEERMRDAHEMGEGKKEKKEKKDKKDKKDKDKKKKGKSVDGEAVENGVDKNDDADAAEDEQDESEEEEVVWMTDTSAAAVAARAAEQLTAATAALVTQGNIEAEKAEAKKRAKAEAKKKAEEEAQRKADELVTLKAALEAGDKLDAAGAETLLRALLDEAGWSWTNGTGGPAAISKVAASNTVKKMSVEGGVAQKGRALYAALFTAEAPSADAEADGTERPKSPGSPKQNSDSTPSGSPKLGPSIGAAKELLAQLAHDAPGQLAQLVALEWLMSVAAPDKLREAPLALKAIYDADLAEEDIILAWHGRKEAAKMLGVPAEGAAAVRKGVQQVVDWLQEAESDEVSEEDEDSEDDE